VLAAITKRRLGASVWEEIRGARVQTPSRLRMKEMTFADRMTKPPAVRRWE
jgi:hypothetical protein